MAVSCFLCYVCEVTCRRTRVLHIFFVFVLLHNVQIVYMILLKSLSIAHAYGSLVYSLLAWHTKHFSAKVAAAHNSATEMCVACASCASISTVCSLLGANGFEILRALNVNDL